MVEKKILLTFFYKINRISEKFFIDFCDGMEKNTVNELFTLQKDGEKHIFKIKRKKLSNAHDKNLFSMKCIMCRRTTKYKNNKTSRKKITYWNTGKNFCSILKWNAGVNNFLLLCHFFPINKEMYPLNGTLFSKKNVFMLLITSQYGAIGTKKKHNLYLPELRSNPSPV